MNHSPKGKNPAIPDEFRKTAEALFPSGGLPAEKGPASAFAKALGTGAEYQHLLGVGKNADEIREFLVHFQNNLDLLIRKTWVEKADESRKEKLLDDIMPFMDSILQGNFQKAAAEFGSILEELAYLLFGPQSAEDDFTEYTFRIDTQMGLFWWYCSQLAGLEISGTVSDDEILWAVLLLGICYLTNF